jgi:hypothetical protein
MAAAAAAVMLVALVAEDPAVLRNAPRDNAPAQATLWRGDWLEVRGESAGFLRVYDHRRERPGYVRPAQVRVYGLDAAAAPELAAVVRFLRDATGYESLGIGYAALALRAAPAGADDSEILAAIGTMADRLARRASARRSDARDPRDATLAAHLEVAESYGVKFKVVEALGGGRGDRDPAARTRICYDGEAWAEVLAAPSAPPLERARAALFLAGARCSDPGTLSPAPSEERALNDQRIEALDTVDFPTASSIPASLLGRVRLRLAEALAWRAFDDARQGAADAAARAEAAAVRQLALADRGVLAPEDLDLYESVAVRVAASRFASEPAAPPPPSRGKRAVSVELAARAPGETCVRVVGADKGTVLGERCTFGVVWQSALRWAPSGTVATIAVQPLAGWTELWVLRAGAEPAGAWTFETLTPATADPDSAAGYVECAGFSPDGARVLVAREARGAGVAVRRFQVLASSSLAVEIWAGSADKLGAFKRWSAPSWRAGTLALR